MEATLHREVTGFSVRKLEQLLSRIEHCLGLLSEEQIWARGGENENAMGNLVLHLSGNVRQWIISGVGGAKDVRQRDSEFDARSGGSPVELAARLRAVVTEAARVIEAISEERMLERIEVQRYEVSVAEAVLHVVEHFSMHTGQILFITKMLTGGDLGFYRHLRSAEAHGKPMP
jgi:uncharacterized damage-inducible protein DinB